MNVRKLLIAVATLVWSVCASAQDKIVYPDISYAGTPRTVTIGGITVSGVDGTPQRPPMAAPPQRSPC